MNESNESFLDMSFDVEIPADVARTIPKMKQEATLIAVKEQTKFNENGEEVPSRFPVKTPMADVIEWAIIKATWEFTFGPVCDFFKKESMTIVQDVFVGITKDGLPSIEKKENGSPVNAGLRRFYDAVKVSLNAPGGLNGLVGKNAMATVGPEERDGQPTGYARVFAVYPVK